MNNEIYLAFILFEIVTFINLKHWYIKIVVEYYQMECGDYKRKTQNSNCHSMRYAHYNEYQTV